MKFYAGDVSCKDLESSSRPSVVNGQFKMLFDKISTSINHRDGRNDLRICLN